MEEDVVVELLIKQKTTGLTADEEKRLEKLLEVSCISRSAYELLAESAMIKKS